MAVVQLPWKHPSFEGISITIWRMQELNKSLFNVCP
jgi:hypothetical protein